MFPDLKWVFRENRKRLAFIVYALLFFYLIVIIRLFIVQIWQQDDYRELAKQNWDREIPFASERGLIYDRNGEVLVKNALAPTLYYLKSNGRVADGVAEQLAPILKVDSNQLQRKLEQSSYLIKLAPEGKNISEEQLAQIRALNIEGLYAGVDYMRSYPYAELMARFIGFTGYDNQGLAGIEYAYERFLKSESAAIALYTDAKGVEMPNMSSEWKAGQNGSDVYLTIDLQLQQIVEKHLTNAFLAYDATQALALAMNPNTGEILALSSLPSFNPNRFQEVDPSLYNQNLPVFMTFEPGSTFKVITLSAAIEEGLVDIENEHFYDSGYAIVEDARLRCWKREGHGHQTFTEVVENSCNPGFIELGNRLGRERLLSYIHDFGFGEKTGSGIAGEASGILFREENFGPVEAATTAFGQGVSVTPIQQVTAISAAINGGKLLTPYIVERIEKANGEVEMEQNPTLKRQVLGEATSVQIRQVLESVVANGSGRQAYREGLRIGGKTGTAQKVLNGHYIDGEYIVSFIGFAPANNPEIIVYVAIDHPKAHQIFGSTIAAPIVGDIIEEYHVNGHLQQVEGEPLQKQYQWGDPITVAVPNYVGLSKEEIMKRYDPLKLQFHGDGLKVVEQLPVSGSKVEENSTIHLFLGI